MRKSLLRYLAFALLPVASSGVSSPPAADGRIAERDNSVILAVLETFLTGPGEDPFMPPWGASKPLLFDMRPICSQLTLDQVLTRHDEKNWRRLTSNQLASVQQAALQFVERAASCGGEFAISHRRIQLRRGDPENAGIFDQTIAAFPPGFSADGRVVIVILGIPWSIHGATGTYVLVRDKADKWHVRVRDLAYYM